MKEYQSGVRDVIFGDNVTIVHPVNLYECSIGKDTFIEVQKGAKIGASTKIQSHSFICDLVTIGDNCFVGHGVCFVNDLFSNGKPAGGDESKWKATSIANNVSIGSNATILPINICANVVIGAGAVVTKNITEAGTYVGNPAKKLK